MSSRNQNGLKKSTKLPTSLSKEKNKIKNEKIKSKEEEDKIVKPKIIERNKLKVIERSQNINKTLSKSLLAGNLSGRSSNSSVTSTKSQELKRNPKIANKNVSNAANNTISPRSQGVTKSQFFPTKQMYSNAIKPVRDASKAKERNTETSKIRERNKTRTLSPSEVKVLKSDSSEPNSLEIAINRPKTATISKAPIKIATDDYEDDFDSYESDFEEYSSSTASEDSETLEVSTSEEEATKIQQEIDEERQLDSGNFELRELKHKQVLGNIKESTENGENRSNLTSLSDEGFEDGKLDKNNQFINFVDAQRKENRQKVISLSEKRGFELSTMIKLDNQIFTLFEMQSVPYSDFIRKFGNNNTIQTAIQTNDDNVTEEIQTDAIVKVDKWTQHPISLREIYKNNVNFNVYKQEILGVGDNINGDTKEIKYNEHSLAQFLNFTGDVILNLLEETSQQRICKDIEINANQIPFSEGFIPFNTKLDYLRDNSVIFANFSNNTTKLITIHHGENGRDSHICIWKISDPNVPENYLKVHGLASCCIYLGNYIYGGLHDGTISIWDLKERTRNNKSPIFMTDISTGHVSKIVSLENVENDADSTTDDDTCNSQVFSLDEDGFLIIWTVITLQTISRKQISLQQTQKISLKQIYSNLIDLQCTNMTINKLDANHIFIATNYGQLIHFVAEIGTKTNPKQFSTGCISRCNGIATCPFSPLYILTSYENGTLNLFSRNTEKPLIALTNCDDEFEDKNGIEFVEWSKNKPCVFYTKDRKNCINIWDLAMSDIFPIYTVPFKENVTFIKLSPGISRDENVKRSYMVIVSENSNISLHILNKDHGQQNLADYENNVKKFLNYVSRL